MRSLSLTESAERKKRSSREYGSCPERGVETIKNKKFRDILLDRILRKLGLAIGLRAVLHTMAEFV